MEDRRGDRPQHPQPGQHDRHAVEAEGEDQDVLADDADRVAGQADRLGQRRRAGRPSGRPSRPRPRGRRRRPPSASPTSARARAGASLMPSPTIATTRPFGPTSLDPVGLAGGRQLGLDLLDMDLLRRPPAPGAARSPVRIARSLSPRCFRSWITSCATRRTRSRAPITPDDPAVHAPRSAPSARLVELLERPSRPRPGTSTPCSRTRRRLPTRTVSRRLRLGTVGASPGLPRRAGPGSRRPPARPARADRASATSSRASGCSLGCSAAAARRSTSSGRPAGPPNRSMQSPSSGLPSVRVPVLSKANVSTRARRLDRRAPLDQHAAAGQPGRRGEHGRRGRQDQGTRAGDDQHGQRRQDVDRRATPAPVIPRQRAGALVATKTTAAAISTAGRNRRA